MNGAHHFREFAEAVAPKLEAGEVPKDPSKVWDKELFKICTDVVDSDFPDHDGQRMGKVVKLVNKLRGEHVDASRYQATIRLRDTQLEEMRKKLELQHATYETKLTEMGKFSETKINEMAKYAESKVKETVKVTQADMAELRKTFELEVTKRNNKIASMQKNNEDLGKSVERIQAEKKELADKNRVLRGRVKTLEDEVNNEVVQGAAFTLGLKSVVEDMNRFTKTRDHKRKRRQTDWGRADAAKKWTWT